MRQRAVFAIAATIPLAVCPVLGARATTEFDVLPLVTNDQAAHPAAITDPDLVNAWGMSYAPTGPFWVSDNGSGVSTLYKVDPATNAVAKQGLTVAIPGDGSVTGQTFNASAGAGAFNGNLFLFASEDGTISGWRGALGTTAEILQTGSSANVYKGTATAVAGGHTYLYSANFRAGTIDVLKGDSGAPDLSGHFIDPTIPAGYAPFNVSLIANTLYVTYALQDADKKDDVPGLGHGYVDAYDLNGNFLGRVASQGTLDSPWGLVIAPSSFGAFAGDLLVGNFGDGTISAFSLLTDSFMGQLRETDGSLLTIDGLWGLLAGNGASAGNPLDLYFSAGPDGKLNGLFGAILPVSVPEPASLLAIGLGRGLAGGAPEA